MLKEMEQEVARIRKNMKETQVRQTSYVDKNRVHREFKFGDHVYLRVKSRKSCLKLRSCAKLISRYFGPFEKYDRASCI
jgi:hypothetical protein